jgi:branched-subunit amino acid aminotransferase/4-amino-4-deoxychorismate lyase
VITGVLINGEPSDGRVPVTDSSVLRGDGCFEVMKSYGGRPFAVDEHLDRLERSAAALDIPLPDRIDMTSWIDEVAAELGDGAVRVIVTRGSSVPGLDDPSNVIVFGHTWDLPPDEGRLLPIEAPWHSAGVPWDLSGAKVTSYAPNMAASRRARAEGYDDALLVTTDGTILEGPTFAVAWVVGERLETPGLDLGILDSITRRLVLEVASGLGIQITEGRWGLSQLEMASEVCAWSTIREVQTVTAVGRLPFPAGPLTAALAKGFRELVG